MELADSLRCASLGKDASTSSPPSNEKKDKLSTPSRLVSPAPPSLTDRPRNLLTALWYEVPRDAVVPREATDLKLVLEYPPVDLNELQERKEALKEANDKLGSSLNEE